MTSTDNRRNGRLLIFAAIAAALLAVVLWSKADQDAEHDRITAGYTEALGGGPADEAEADHTASLAAGGLAAVLFLGGIILVATAPSED